MDKDEKKRLKKLGKAVVEQRSAQLRAQLDATNPAPFASDDYVRNEIAIREKERAIRGSDRVHHGADVRRDFTMRPLEFDLRHLYPASPDNFWECRRCGDFLPTLTQRRLICSCGNVCLDAAAGTFAVRDEGILRLVRLLGKVAE
ncbi:MAG: hypothetical protein JNM56_39690 [Planctomycetia bacterium]|nr:hypothetical protein [Planctomycetia bacterium]